VVRLAQQGEWGKLGHHSATATKKGLHTVVTEARDRHSVLQVAAPLTLDGHDPAHLRDTQACQIFWNCLAIETVVQFMWSQTSSTTTVCDEEFEANATADQHANATENAGGCTAGSSKILTMMITGGFAAGCIITTAVVCRIAFRFGNRPTRRLWAGRTLHGIAWAFNLGFWACCCWVVVAYGRCLMREETNAIILSSLVGLSMSWFVMEPLWIVLIAGVPCLCNNSFMSWFNDRASDIGLDLSLLLG